MISIRSLVWQGKQARIIDQTKLPNSESYLEIRTIEQMAEAIRKLRIRGAPAIGIAAAFGLVLGARPVQHLPRPDFEEKLNSMAEFLLATRPTAVNLGWAIKRLLARIGALKDFTTDEAVDVLEKEALAILEEDVRLCEKIGSNGAAMLETDPISVLTHCNAGALATGGQGTALSVIYELQKKGRSLEVFVDETRPLLQGSRLTAWELQKAGIPATLLCDNMAAPILAQGKVDCVIVGADRIAANGDTANKIGTFTLALLAEYFGVPFYVAAPYSTFDLSIERGERIPIEERSPKELKQIGEQIIAPDNTRAYNPAFDITPNHLIRAFITDSGIIRPPYISNIRQIQLKS
jgi:methylthioribose-1-phosphate isomerase